MIAALRFNTSERHLETKLASGKQDLKSVDQSIEALMECDLFSLFIDMY